MIVHRPRPGQPLRRGICVCGVRLGNIVLCRHATNLVSLASTLICRRLCASEHAYRVLTTELRDVANATCHIDTV